MKKSTKKKIDDFLNEKIIPMNLEKIISDRFGKYSKYIIQDRALPDVRDGLKPVHRRILYAMHVLGMGSNKPFKKSARIVGDVIGKYHPHGDQSVYDAMVRMSQYWKTNNLLIDMHGNNIVYAASVYSDIVGVVIGRHPKVYRSNDTFIKYISNGNIKFHSSIS